jgi:DNA-binding NarL/FixJ family response regulator
METIVKPSKPTTSKPAGRNPVSVWLVEDNHAFRDAVASVVDEVADMECSRKFSNAEDALGALMAGEVPDVILLDVELPGQNGIQAVRKIKVVSPSTRVLMLTVFEDHEKVFKAICAGASGYLLKTSEVEQIVESIREAVSGGAPMTPRVAKSVLEMFSDLAKPKGDYGLTDREQEVLRLMTEGLIKKEIAELLEVTFHTVDMHMRNIYAKLHVHNSSSAVALALKKRLF